MQRELDLQLGQRKGTDVPERSSRPLACHRNRRRAPVLEFALAASAASPSLSRPAPRPRAGAHHILQPARAGDKGLLCDGLCCSRMGPGGLRDTARGVNRGVGRGRVVGEDGKRRGAELGRAWSTEKCDTASTDPAASGEKPRAITALADEIRPDQPSPRATAAARFASFRMR